MIRACWRPLAPASATTGVASTTRTYRDIIGGNGTQFVLTDVMSNSEPKRHVMISRPSQESYTAAVLVRPQLTRRRERDVSNIRTPWRDSTRVDENAQVFVDVVSTTGWFASAVKKSCDRLPKIISTAALLVCTIFINLLERHV